MHSPTLGLGVDHEAVLHDTMTPARVVRSGQEPTPAMRKTRQNKPGSPLYPHTPPWWVRLVLLVGQLVMRRCFPCAITGLEHYSATPATLVVSNHRRDADGPLLGAAVLRRRGLHLYPPLPHFVAREDLFEKGFLAHYWRHGPAPLRAVLTRVNLRRFLLRCGAHPLQRTHEQSVAAVLQVVLLTAGDMPVAQAIRPSRLPALASAIGFDATTARISDLVRGHDDRLWRRRHGYRHLRLAMFRRIRPRLHANIKRQLADFIALLDAGHLLILEPEGRLSRDGGLRRPRAALHALVNRQRRAVRVLPVAMTYDELTSGKPRIFVDIQLEIDDPGGLDRRALDSQIMAAIRSGCRVTGAQLAASFLLRLDSITDSWTPAALARDLADAAQTCKAEMLALDPQLLTSQDCETRARDFIKWGLRTSFLVVTKQGSYQVSNPDMPPPWLPDGPVTLLQYLRAELETTVGAARAHTLGLLP